MHEEQRAEGPHGEAAERDRRQEARKARLPDSQDQDEGERARGEADGRNRDGRKRRAEGFELLEKARGLMGDPEPQKVLDPACENDQRDAGREADRQGMYLT